VSEDEDEDEISGAIDGLIRGFDAFLS